MIDADAMLGIQKPDHDGLKEVKVKLPVKQLLKLHYMKLTSGKTFSYVITNALNDYFRQVEGIHDSEETKLDNEPLN